MTDMEFDLMTALDLHITNDNMLKSKDRDIKGIVFDCYSNLRNCLVAAYDWSNADLKTVFNCTFKKYLITLGKGKNVEESANVEYLDNIFSKLRIKYILDPEHIAPKFRRIAIKNTLDRWDGWYNNKGEVLETGVSGYGNVDLELKKRLENELAKEDKAWEEILAKWMIEKAEAKSGKVKKRGSVRGKILEQQNLKAEEKHADLFVQEQILLVPEIDRNGKYTIDGINYYGVYNAVDKEKLTKKKELSTKVFKDSIIRTPYFGVTHDKDFGDILYVQWYGEVYNPFHLLTKENIIDVNPTDLLVFNNEVHNKKWEEIIDNTWQKAVYMDENVSEFTLGEGVKNVKTMHHCTQAKYRAGNGERRFKVEINIALRSLLEKLGEGEEDTEKEKAFVHLDVLEEVILRNINGESKVPKNINPSIGAKRINLQPTAMITTMKKNSNENSDSVLFKDNKKDPNPFDIFNIFAYSKVTMHTQTNSNQHVSAKAKNTGEASNWIKWQDIPYLSIYFSKNNVPLGKNNILHFSIDDSQIIERSKRKEIHSDIYNARTLL